MKEERTRQADTLQLEERSFEESRTDVRPSGKSPSTSVIVSIPFLQTNVSFTPSLTFLDVLLYFTFLDFLTSDIDSRQTDITVSVQRGRYSRFGRL